MSDPDDDKRASELADISKYGYDSVVIDPNKFVNGKLVVTTDNTHNRVTILKSDFDKLVEE